MKSKKKDHQDTNDYLIKKAHQLRSKTRPRFRNYQASTQLDRISPQQLLNSGLTMPGGPDSGAKRFLLSKQFLNKNVTNLSPLKPRRLKKQHESSNGPLASFGNFGVNAEFINSNFVSYQLTNNNIIPLLHDSSSHNLNDESALTGSKNCRSPNLTPIFS